MKVQQKRNNSLRLSFSLLTELASLSAGRCSLCGKNLYEWSCFLRFSFANESNRKLCCGAIEGKPPMAKLGRFDLQSLHAFACPYVLVLSTLVIVSSPAPSRSSSDWRKLSSASPPMGSTAAAPWANVRMRNWSTACWACVWANWREPVVVRGHLPNAQ